MPELQKIKKSASPAAILILLLLAAVASPLHLNKVSPIAPFLMDTFGIGETQLGLLISVLPLTGIALALPGGMLIRKFGPWRCMLAALIALLVGSVAGALTGSFAMLVMSRIVEGIGMALIAVAGPSIIGETSSSKSRGFAMGLFASYMGIGQVIAFNLAPRVLHLGGWQPVWWFSSAYTVVFLFVWLALMLRVGASAKPPATGPAAKSAEQAPSIFKSKAIWLLAAAVGLYIVSYVSIQTFLPTYLAEVRGMALADAASLVSICCLMGTVSSLIAGSLSDRTGSRRVLGAASMAIGAVLFAAIPFVPTGWFLPFVVVLGMIPPVLPVCVFAAASEALDSPEQGGMAMGIVTLGQNIGMAVGPLLFGAVTEAFGWNASLLMTVPIALGSGMVMLMNRKVR